MKKFIPYEKLSKSKQREVNKSKRVFWNCDPVTKTVPSKKVYSRKVKHKSANGCDNNYR